MFTVILTFLGIFVAYCVISVARCIWISIKIERANAIYDTPAFYRNMPSRFNRNRQGEQRW